MAQGYHPILLILVFGLVTISEPVSSQVDPGPQGLTFIEKACFSSDGVLSCPQSSPALVIYKAQIKIFTAHVPMSCDSQSDCFTVEQKGALQRACYLQQHCNITLVEEPLQKALCPGATGAVYSVEYVCVKESEVGHVCEKTKGFPRILQSPDYPHTYPSSEGKDKCTKILTPHSQQEQHSLALEVTILDMEVLHFTTLKNCRHPSVNRSVGNVNTWSCPSLGVGGSLHIMDLPVNISVPLQSAITYGRGVLFYIEVIDRIELCVDEWNISSTKGVLHSPDDSVGLKCNMLISPQASPPSEVFIALDVQYVDSNTAIYSCHHQFIVQGIEDEFSQKGCSNVTMDTWIEYEDFVSIDYKQMASPVVVAYEVIYRMNGSSTAEATTQSAVLSTQEASNSSSSTSAMESSSKTTVSTTLETTSVEDHMTTNRVPVIGESETESTMTTLSTVTSVNVKTTPSPTTMGSARTTEMSNSSSTNMSTSSPFNMSTSSPTNMSASSPTNMSTSSPTNMSTSSPTNMSTSSPTNMSTSSPTDMSTFSPTNMSTSSPTNMSTSTQTAPQQTTWSATENTSKTTGTTNIITTEVSTIENTETTTTKHPNVIGEKDDKTNTVGKTGASTSEGLSSSSLGIVLGVVITLAVLISVVLAVLCLYKKRMYKRTSGSDIPSVRFENPLSGSSHYDYIQESDQSLHQRNARHKDYEMLEDDPIVYINKSFNEYEPLGEQDLMGFSNDTVNDGGLSNPLYGIRGSSTA